MDDGEGQQRWIDAGRPMMPSVLFDGATLPLHHPSQIPAMIGSPEVVETSSARRVAWDCTTILEDFIEMIRSATWDQLNIPTPYRDRSTRNLTVNVFRPIAMLPESWVSRRFDWWAGEADLQQEALLGDKDALVAFATDIFISWQSFLLDNEDAIANEDPIIGSNRGDVPYSTLLLTHRFHSANHHRQIRDVLGRHGVDVSERLKTGEMTDIGLPAELYGV